MRGFGRKERNTNTINARGKGEGSMEEREERKSAKEIGRMEGELGIHWGMSVLYLGRYLEKSRVGFGHRGIKWLSTTIHILTCTHLYHSNRN